MKALLFTLGLVLTALSSFAYDPVSLNIAIERDDLRTVKKLVANGEITVNEKIRASPYSNAPIIAIAGRAASLKVLEFLIQNGADLDAQTPPGETALMLAAFFNDDDSQTQPIYVRHETATKMLVEAGAQIENGEEYSALAYAAYQSHDRIVDYLLKKGAKPDSGAVNGVSKVNTPLMMSCMAGNLRGTLLLLRAGADARVVNSQGKRALELAKAYNKTNMIPYIKCAESLAPGESFTDKCE